MTDTIARAVNDWYAAGDLLISREWEHLPEPEPSNPLQRAVRFVSTWYVERRWTRWSTVDWIYALAMVSAGLGLVHQVVAIYATLRGEQVSA